MKIPTDEQIDAILTGHVWHLVRRYCGGDWRSLARAWTASAADITAEAERRGFASFVNDHPTSEGYWICSAGGAFKIVYFERGCLMDRTFCADLPTAFSTWLEHELKSLQLNAN